LSNKLFAFLLGRVQGGTIKIEAKPTRESCVELLDPDNNINKMALLSKLLSPSRLLKIKKLLLYVVLVVNESL